MRDSLEVIGRSIRIALASLLHSMRALVDDRITSDDLLALLWLAAISLVVVVVAWVLRAHDRSRMR
jgi:CHASE2 domain-containing sensor protein